MPLFPEKRPWHFINWDRVDQDKLEVAKLRLEIRDLDRKGFYLFLDKFVLAAIVLALGIAGNSFVTRLQANLKDAFERDAQERKFAVDRYMQDLDERFRAGSQALEHNLQLHRDERTKDEERIRQLMNATLQRELASFTHALNERRWLIERRLSAYSEIAIQLDSLQRPKSKQSARSAFVRLQKSISTHRLVLSSEVASSLLALEHVLPNQLSNSARKQREVTLQEQVPAILQAMRVELSIPDK